MVNEPEKLPGMAVSSVRVFSFLLNAGFLPLVRRADPREAGLRHECERFWFFLSEKVLVLLLAAALCAAAGPTNGRR